MRILKSRVSKLELTINPQLPVIHIQRFIVDPGGLMPIGYRCADDGTEIMQQPEETEKEFKARCHNSVVWPPGTSRHIFSPIYEPEQIF